MTLNQSALRDLLKELELTETTERIRLLTQRAFQELINAEATAVIGAAPYERARACHYISVSDYAARLIRGAKI